jgi:PHD finger-like domain-containing protein 5A
LAAPNYWRLTRDAGFSAKHFFGFLTNIGLESSGIATKHSHISPKGLLWTYSRLKRILYCYLCNCLSTSKHVSPSSVSSILPKFSTVNANTFPRDLVMCRKQAGIAIGRLCDKCDGKCPVCDSYVRPTTLVRICDECSFGNYQNKCVVCGGEGISDAFYCFECTRLEKDRDGCPKIINLGSSRTDLFYQKKSFRNQ